MEGLAGLAQGLQQGTQYYGMNRANFMQIDEAKAARAAKTEEDKADRAERAKQFAESLGLQREQLAATQENTKASLDLQRILGLGNLDVAKLQAETQAKDVASTIKAREEATNLSYDRLDLDKSIANDQRSAEQRRYALAASGQRLDREQLNAQIRQWDSQAQEAKEGRKQQKELAVAELLANAQLTDAEYQQQWATLQTQYVANNGARMMELIGSMETAFASDPDRARSAIGAVVRAQMAANDIVEATIKANRATGGANAAKLMKSLKIAQGQLQDVAETEKSQTIPADPDERKAWERRIAASIESAVNTHYSMLREALGGGGPEDKRVESTINSILGAKPAAPKPAPKLNLRVR